MTDEEPSRPGVRGAPRAWQKVLRPVIALALITFVATRVPWQDRLISAPLNGPQESWEGEILGEWKADSVRFRFVPGAQPANDSDLLNGRAASAMRHGGQVHVTSDALTSVEWTAGPTEKDPSSEPVTVAGQFSWRPGIPRAFAELDLGGLIPGLGFLFLGTLFAVTRWWRLLLIIGTGAKWGSALRLTYVGLFFNLIVPGLNGGDLARAVLAVRENPDRRADALMTVIIDRLIGLLAMVALAALVIIAIGERLEPLRLPVILTLCVLVGGLCAFFTPSLRRLLRFDALLERLPQSERLHKLDRALQELLQHPGEMLLALALSVGNHLCVTAAVFSIGHAFGDALSYQGYLAAVTVSNTVSSLPLSPGGWGIGEYSYGKLFEMLGAVPTLGVAASVTYRLCWGFLGLCGGLALLLPGGAGARAELRDQRSQAAG